MWGSGRHFLTQTSLHDSPIAEQSCNGPAYPGGNVNLYDVTLDAARVAVLVDSVEHGLTRIGDVVAMSDEVANILQRYFLREFLCRC